MIIDLQTENVPSQFKCDVCIVGSGAAGMTLATEFLSTSLNVLVIESGGMDHEPITQALYDVDVSGLPHPGSTEGRFRICGGSTTRWGGQALPLMAIDFEQREWVAHSGWPISRKEVADYYPRACRFLLVDEMNLDTDLFAHLRTRPPVFDEQKLWYHFSRWSPEPNIREHYLSALRRAEHCTLMLHANVIDIALKENLRRVKTIEVSSLQGRTTKIEARKFVLCSGGIEAARLLLAANRQAPTGIGNEHDLVGRFFQDHPSAMVGWLEPCNANQAQALFNLFHKNGLKYSVRCTATTAWQREHRSLNASMGITFVQDDSTLQDFKDAYVALRCRQLNAEVWRKLLYAAAHPSAVISPIWHFFVRGRSFAPKARFRVGITSEQEPNPESRITLAQRTDSLGMRRANVCWQPTELTRHTLHQFAQLLSEQFQRAGIGEIELDPWMKDCASWKEHITDQFHHIGTTRMADSPQTGVVDRNCRVHSIENLYIGSSAVFPTSGHSNPTLTIIALCMRMADQMKAELS
jgi:choline dehydrogenase-like flavoprotein